MKTLKRFFWLITGMIMIFGYGIIAFFALIIWGGEKMDNKIKSPFDFLHDKLK